MYYTSTTKMNSRFLRVAGYYNLGLFLLLSRMYILYGSPCGCEGARLWLVEPRHIEPVILNAVIGRLPTGQQCH